MKKILLKIFVALTACVLPIQVADASTWSDGGLPDRAPIAAMAQSDSALAWADSVMSTLSMRQRVEQLVIPRLDVTDNAAGRAAVRRAVVDQQCGGLLLGKGTLADYAALIAYAQSVAPHVPLMITLDGEWGLRMRVTDAVKFPSNMSLGAIADEAVLEAYGAEVARQCRAVGIHVNFAPVLDVNSNPRNPVIGYRSFGQDPERVSAAGLAYSRGLEGGGVLSVAKHFPGHGDTSTDSHKTLPRVDHSAAQLRGVDLLPFVRYSRAGLGGVMVGHLNVPSLDPSGVPASLSHYITTDLLRHDIGFEGLVFTDALAMAGANSGINNCVAALAAGADVLLQPRKPAADVDAVMAALGNGTLTKDMVDDRCRRVLAFKYALGLSRRPAVQAVDKAVASASSADGEAVAARLARNAVTVVSNRDALLPIADLSSRTISVVSLGAPADNLFAATCSRYAHVELVSAGEAGLSKARLAALAESDVVVMGVFSDKPWARTMLDQILKECPASVGVFFMNPYKVAHFGGALTALDALVVAGDDTPGLREAGAEAIFGGCAVSGRLPVDLPPVGKAGQGISLPKVRLGYGVPQEEGFAPEMTSRIDSAMKAAVASGAVPGAQVVVVRRGSVVHSGCYGTVGSGERRAVTDSTIYDLASVSKAIATVPALMRAYDEDLFRLDDPLSRAIESLDTTDKAAITYREALYHVTGMPSMISAVNVLTEKGRGRQRQVRPDLVSTTRRDGYTQPLASGLWLSDAVADTMLSRIYSATLRDPGTYRYSDLNFCMLKEACERLTEVPHDEWVSTEIYGRLGASTLGFCPRDYYPLRHIAPTENDALFRRQTVRGYVHDETAAAFGGVQGNAGLFGNALDVAKVCQMWLNGGCYGGEEVIKPSTVEMFTGASSCRTLTDSKGREARRGLGFAFADPDSPLSPQSYGHTGFTGTCFWVDPTSDIIVVFLSNRVNPSRKTPAFFRDDPRQALLKVVYESLPQENEQ